MKLRKIVCLGFSGSELEDSYWREIDGLSENRVLAADETEALKNNDADGLLVRLGAKINKDLIDKFPNLKYIGMLGTGYGGIDTDYAASKGITVTNIADYATEAVGEFTFAILLEYLREISRARKQAKDGNYSDDSMASEIKGKQFGVIGLGNIGKRTAELAQAFGAEVCYWSRERKNEVENKDIKYLGLTELISSSDFITLNLALNSETEGIITADLIAKIKPQAIFINPSPMELVDFSALVERLIKKELVFMLDHSDEMSQEQLSELQPLDNAIVYPPIAYLTKEAGQLKKRIYIDNLKNFLAGKPTNKVS